MDIDSRFTTFLKQMFRPRKARNARRARCDGSFREIADDCAISARRHFPYCGNALEYQMCEKDGRLRSIDPSVSYLIKPTNKERL